MTSIGNFAVRRARLVLIAALLAVVGFGVLGSGAFGKLKTGGFLTLAPSRQPRRR